MFALKEHHLDHFPPNNNIILIQASQMSFSFYTMTLDFSLEDELLVNCKVSGRQ